MNKPTKPSLIHPANMTYTATQAMGLLNVGTMTLSRYARLGLIKRTGYNTYTKASIDRLNRMSQRQRNEAIREARKHTPEATAASNLPEYAVIFEFPATVTTPNPYRALLKYASMRKRTRGYPIIYFIDTETYRTPQFMQLLEGVRMLAPVGMRFEVLPPSFSLQKMQESCILTLRTKEEFEQWQAACEGNYLEPQEDAPPAIPPPPTEPVVLARPAGEQPLPEGLPDANSIATMTDGTQAIFQDDRLFNLHSRTDWQEDIQTHRYGMNRLHYRPTPPTQSLIPPRLHNAGSALSHLRDSHALAANEDKLHSNPDLKLLLEDQLEEENEVLTYFITSLSQYMYRLIIKVRNEGTFPRDEEGNMVLPDRLNAYLESLPEDIQFTYSTESRMYPPGYIVSFSALTEPVRESVKDGPGVPRTYEEKLAILKQAEEINRFLP